MPECENSLHWGGNPWQFRSRRARPGGDVHRRNLPRGKFEPVAGSAIAPYGGSSEIRRAAEGRCHWLFLDGGALGAQLGGHIPRGDATGTPEAAIKRAD